MQISKGGFYKKNNFFFEFLFFYFSYITNALIKLNTNLQLILQDALCLTLELTWSISQEKRTSKFIRIVIQLQLNTIISNYPPRSFLIYIFLFCSCSCSCSLQVLCMFYACSVHVLRKNIGNLVLIHAFYS